MQRFALEKNTPAFTCTQTSYSASLCLQKHLAGTCLYCYLSASFSQVPNVTVSACPVGFTPLQPSDTLAGSFASPIQQYLCRTGDSRAVLYITGQTYLGDFQVTIA